MSAEKTRKIIAELTRIRNELRELVSESSAGGSSGGDSGDPLEEILGATSLPIKNAAALEDEDVIVVDVSLPGSQTVPSSQPKAPPTPPILESERDAKSFPKKPPPRKRK